MTISSVEVLVAGERLSTPHALSIQHRLNALPSASIQLAFSSLTELDQVAKRLLPGNKVDIHSNDTPLFLGVIATQKIQYSVKDTLLILNCCHAATALTTLPQNQIFHEMTDGEIIHQILASHGIEAYIDSSGVQHEYLIQHNTSDWNFVLQRLQETGLVACCNGNTVTVTSPELGTANGFPLPHENIISLEIDIDTYHQVDALELQAWCYSNQALETVEAKNIDFPVNAHLSAFALLGKDHPVTKVQRISGEYTLPQLQIMADALLAYSRLSLVQGTITAQSLHVAYPGQTLLLSDISHHLSGHYYISGITYELAPGAAPVTHFQIGLPRKICAEPTNSKQLPTMLTGIVQEVSDDPAVNERIKVTCPLIDPTGQGVWARLATLQAGEFSGTIFTPSIGDEVILGLNGSDLNNIVVIGAVHSPAMPRPWTNPSQYGYKSPNGLLLSLDDAGQEIQISTQNGPLLKLSQDGKESLVLEDQHNNSIHFSQAGIHLQSRCLSLEGNDIKMNGQNIEIKAGSLKLNSEATAEISATSILALKGSMIHIN